MSLSNELIVFLLIPYLDKKSAKSLSLLNKEYLRLMNKNIEKQMIQFGNTKKQFPCMKDFRYPFTSKPSYLEHLEKKGIEVPDNVEVFSDNSYMQLGGFELLAMISPRQEITYGRWNEDYFYLSYRVIQNYVGDGSIKHTIDRLVISKSAILLPFHTYSMSKNVTDWLATK